MKISLVVGARPNFVKAAAILHTAKKFPQLQFDLIHTGQHKNIMSDPYFKDLELPKPDFKFGPFLGSPVKRLAAMTELLSEEVFDSGDYRPDMVMVVGDTDSTLAGALAAVKNGLPVAHVEAGNRCGDRKMQEEINRILVDSVSTKLYTTTEDARERLIQEGHDWNNTVFVGNVMVDTLYRFLPEAKKRYQRSGPYAVLTLHRAENVDNPDVFAGIINGVMGVAQDIPVIWPVHPRCGYVRSSCVTTVDPMGYLQFISTLAGASFVMTDSGGVQEETTALGVPCMTLRPSTERPETICQGSNRLVGTDPEDIMRVGRFLNGCTIKQYPKPDKWDGHAAERILEGLCVTS